MRGVIEANKGDIVECSGKYEYVYPESPWRSQKRQRLECFDSTDHATVREATLAQLTAATAQNRESHDCIVESSNRIESAIRFCSSPEVAGLLESAPAFVGAMKLTCGQRLAMIAYARGMTEDVFVKYAVDLEKLSGQVEADMRSHAGRRRDTRTWWLSRPKDQPLGTQATQTAGTMSRFNVIDFPTGCGKTVWSLMAAAMQMAHYWRTLLDAWKRGNTGLVIGPKQRLARLVIAAVPPSTRGHFEKTLYECRREMSRVWPYQRFEVWRSDAMHRTEDARDDTVTFWVLPINKLNEVLRQSPEVTIAMLIIDEFTVNTPRFATASRPTSQVWRTMVLQATPEALEQASGGTTNLVKSFFCNTQLASLTSVPFSVYDGHPQQAHTALTQNAMLDLVSMTFWGHLIRFEMETLGLLPKGIRVYNILSRCENASSYLSGSDSGVPANFANTVLSQFKGLPLKPQCIDSLKEVLDCRTCSLEQIKTALDSVEGMQTDANTVQKIKRTRERIVERLDEFFSSGCPVCGEKVDDDDQRNESFKIFGCCGQMMCTGCSDNWSRQQRLENREPTCAFCRRPVHSTIPREHIPTNETFSVVSNYPLSSAVVDKGTLQDTLFENAKQGLNQPTNLTLALHALMLDGKRRVVVMVKIPHTSFRRESELMDKFIDCEELQSATGYVVKRVDKCLASSGRRAAAEFSEIKSQFDSPDADPMVLLSFTDGKKFVVGTDLFSTDAIVTVGVFVKDTLTQMMGRALRPNPARKVGEIPFVQISSPVRQAGGVIDLTD